MIHFKTCRCGRRRTEGGLFFCRKNLITGTPKLYLLVYKAQLYSRELQVHVGFFDVSVKRFNSINFILSVLRMHVGYSQKCIHLRIRGRHLDRPLDGTTKGLPITGLVEECSPHS